MYKAVILRDGENPKPVAKAVPSAKQGQTPTKGPIGFWESLSYLK